MQQTFWILAIISMSILLIINVLMLIERIKLKLNKKQKKVEDTIVISLELDTTKFEKELKKVSKKTDDVAKKTRKPRTKKDNLSKEQ